MSNQTCALCGRDHWLLIHRPDLDPMEHDPVMSHFYLCKTCQGLIDIEVKLINQEINRQYEANIDRVIRMIDPEACGKA